MLAARPSSLSSCYSYGFSIIDAGFIRFPNTSRLVNQTFRDSVVLLMVDRAVKRTLFVQ